MHTRTTILPRAALTGLSAAVFFLCCIPTTHARFIDPSQDTATNPEPKTSTERDTDSTIPERYSTNNVARDMFIPILFGVSLSDITPNFGDPRDGGARTHEGLDMLAPSGTPVVSPTPATVLTIRNGTYSGKHVITANPGGERYEYMHLDTVADIEKGDRLRTGDLIGLVGDTGNARGGPAHLHFEIGDGRTARDPYTRISIELTLEDKMEILSDILDDYDDDDFVEFLADEYESVFVQARILNIDIPRDIERELPKAVRNATLGTTDLSVGADGVAVSALQTTLIAGGYLTIATPTGYFGPLTKAALIAYQRAENIYPATGTYGPRTRVAMGVGSSSTARTAAAPSADLQLTDIIQLFLALGVIPAEKEQLAYNALEALAEA